MLTWALLLVVALGDELTVAIAPVVVTDALLSDDFSADMGESSDSLDRVRGLLELPGVSGGVCSPKGACWCGLDPGPEEWVAMLKFTAVVAG